MGLSGRKQLIQNSCWQYHPFLEWFSAHIPHPDNELQYHKEKDQQHLPPPPPQKTTKSLEAGIHLFLHRCAENNSVT